MSKRHQARTTKLDKPETAPRERSHSNGLENTVENRRSTQDGQGAHPSCPPHPAQILTSATRSTLRKGSQSVPLATPEPVFDPRARVLGAPVPTSEAPPLLDRPRRPAGSTVLDAYAPSHMSERDWALIAPFVLEATTTALVWHSREYDAKDMIGAVAALTRWGTQVACLPMNEAILFHRDTIAEFIAHGCGGLTIKSRGTLRSRLLRVAEAVLPASQRVTRLTPLNFDRAMSPYTTTEIRKLHSWAEGQTTPMRRMESRAIVALGVGGGLANRDINHLLAGDIQVDPAGVLLHVRRADSSRYVPLLVSYEKAIVDLVAVKGPGDYFVGSRRVTATANWLNQTIAKSRPEGAFRPSPVRMRNTWIVHHLITGTPLGPLAGAAGLDTFRTIEKLLQFVPVPSHSEIRHSMRRALQMIS